MAEVPPAVALRHLPGGGESVASSSVSGDVPTVTCSGWLIKRGGTIRSWKKRWFELRPSGDITYSESPAAKKVINTITVAQLLGVVRREDCDTAWPVLVPERCFGVRTTRRIYFAYGEMEDGIRWRGCILASLAKNGASTTIRKDALAMLHALLTEHPSYKGLFVAAGVVRTLQALTETEQMVTVREDARAISKLFTDKDIEEFEQAVEVEKQILAEVAEEVSEGRKPSPQTMRRRAETAPAISLIPHRQESALVVPPEFTGDPDSDSATDDDQADLAESSDDDDFNDGLGCRHYKRRCLLKAPCCNRYHACRLCHDEDSDNVCDQEMDRYAVQEIKCMICDTEQPVGKRCIKCGIRFGRYTCLKCRLYDNEDKGQFHCDECGLCRKGGRENFKHCDKCHACLKITHFDSHKCVDHAMDRNCPVCLENLNASTTKPVTSPRCGHILHTECLHKLIQSSRPNCPLCARALYDMTEHDRQLDEEIRSTPMPEEYRDQMVKVLCNECNVKSTVQFHIVGHKCGECRSYNTRQIEGPFPIPDGGAAAADTQGTEAAAASVAMAELALSSDAAEPADSPDESDS